MRSRQFVFTWWAGLVRDTFGPNCLFHVARFGHLRIRRRLAERGDWRGMPVGGDNRPPAAAVVVASRGL